MRYVIPILLLALPVTLLAVEDPTPMGRNPHGNIIWNCSDCHTSESWDNLRPDIKFDHAQTGFNLIGAHKQADCAACHKDSVFSHIGTACLDCHADHHQGQLRTDCAECHTPRDWQPRQELLLQHAERGFPLTGAHAATDCEACHQGHSRLEYIGTPTNCEACHTSELHGVTDPDHTQAAFQDGCERCHNAAFGTWARTTYDHPSSFPLTGAHQTLPCNACHAAGFVGTATQCFACHSSEFAATDNPDHEAAGFSTECQTCHTTVAWEPASFDHNSTAFPLNGAHLTADCMACHADGFAGTATQCFACHSDEYTSTSDPDHDASGFSTECQTCHSTIAWEPASFDHNSTAFPLLGAHQTLACIACHQTVYAGTPTVCIACHQQDYDATTDPNHATAQFPTDCENCHGFNAWTPANWDHDALYFPIYSGPHREKWNNCVECHTVPTDYILFDCTACHEHNQTDMDNKHGEVNNYQYVSAACYSCHPTGRSD